MKIMTVFHWKIKFFLVFFSLLNGVVVGQNAMDLMVYFGDQFGGNQDGKFDVNEGANLTLHHLGAAYAVSKLKLDKESVLAALFTSDKRKEEDLEYGEAFKTYDAGFAVLAKADKFDLINGLWNIKGWKEALSADSLVYLSMAELSAAYLMVKRQWKVGDLRALLSSPDGREGLTLFIKAGAWGMSWRKKATSSRTSFPEMFSVSDTRVPHEKKVIDAIAVLTGKTFSPAALAALSGLVSGTDLTDKTEMILRQAGVEVEH